MNRAAHSRPKARQRQEPGATVSARAWCYCCTTVFRIDDGDALPYRRAWAMLRVKGDAVGLGACFGRGYIIAVPLVASLFSGPVGALKAQQTPAAKKVLARTPPMGWNSWDSYGL